MVTRKSYQRPSKGDWKAYWQFPEKGYPKRVYWVVIAPRGARLTYAQETDLLFDERDYKIRQLPIPKEDGTNNGRDG